MPKQYWLMKSEPDAFSIDDLAAVAQEPWSGVRNYQARNSMRDDMRVGDEVLFYHSNAKPAGIAGLARIARTAYPDETQFDPESDYYDPKATRETPRWFMVDVQFVSKFSKILSLAEIKSHAHLFSADFVPVRKGSRLSVAPVSAEDFRTAVQLAKSKR
ncbi:EVE domain-containing protein [Luteimonas sp. FXH3W]|jgi:predicted RNA-binding protein with PUA-like domain|uniref:EVE domain-containing protein n=1 Tax=Aquilutibacter rugosus TaxID=3115820 RepID=A0ABU7UXY2_9GAMM